MKSIQKTIKMKFAKYVFQSVLAMIGLSLYILADTFFISKAVGSDGITALNLALPIYGIIFAIGSMIGVGSAIRFSIEKDREKDNDNNYFFNALLWGTVIGIIFSVIGLVFPDKVISIMGGDDIIIKTGISYFRIFMSFAPFFIWNYICNAFVRNDGNPSVSMAATLLSSLFNIVFDYVLMFPLGLSMEGAALATALSPLVGILICCIHFRSEKCTVKFKPMLPSLRKILFCCQFGVSSFVGEISSGVITVVFNMIILGLAGNTGVAAYGVVANTSLVAVALFNGIAQGSQPLVSEAYGRDIHKDVKTYLKMAVTTAVGVSVLLVIFIYLFAPVVTAVFNGEHNRTLADYAETGLRIYFIGFLFAGINIVGTAILSAVESTKYAFAASISRGFVAIIFFAFILSAIFGLNGVWMAFPAAEFVTMLITLCGLRRIKFVDKNS